MKRALLAAAIVLIASVAGHSTSLMAGLSLSKAKTARQDLPDGPGKDEVARLCAGCHDLTFTISTRETEEGWTRIVNDMRSRGADGTEEEFARVIAYLTAHMGKKEAPAEPTPPQAVSIGDPARRVADDPAALTVFPAVVSTGVAPGSTLDFTARVAYEVCQETCLSETATASIKLPVGDGGAPSHEEEFTRAGAPMPR